jgi:hypothetical protein
MKQGIPIELVAFHGGKKLLTSNLVDGEQQLPRLI